MELVLIMIDGNTIDPRNCRFHAQENPWPGGLHYEMRIKDTDILQDIKAEYSGREKEAIDVQNANWIFNYINLVISLKWGKRPPQYWLNSISNMIINQDEVVLKGECSAHQMEPRR